MRPRRFRTSPGQRRFHTLPDADLLDLLYSAADRLPREVVDEVLRRTDRFLPLLHDIVADKTSWTQPLPEWWAVVHSTYILGAMETPEALTPLLCALRWADAFDCDWVTEDLPSMFGRLGDRAWSPVSTLARDQTAGPGARSIALCSMASIGLEESELLTEAVQLAARCLADPLEDLYLRQTAANLLVDFRVREHLESLRDFGREEARRRREDSEYQAVFFDWELDELLEADAEVSRLEYYRRDWLTFYDPEEVERRQERWSREQEAAPEPAAAESPSATRDLNAPCPCGSGRPHAHCCYLRVH
jgi:hypothetical protein